MLLCNVWLLTKWSRGYHRLILALCAIVTAVIKQNILHVMYLFFFTIT